jgi:hypothetical protein
VIPDFFPWEIPGFRYNHYRAVDLGIRNPTTCLWFVVDSYGQIYVYMDYGEPNLPLPKQAENILAATHGKSVRMTFIDPRADTRDMGTGFRKLDVLSSSGLICVPSANDHVLTFSRVSELLLPSPSTGVPRLRICKRCERLRREMRRYRYRDHATRLESLKSPMEDSQRVDDDFVDALRYGMAFDLPYIEEEAEDELVFPRDPITGY